MDREEYLKLAQQTPDRGKEYERNFILKIDTISLCIGLLIGVVMLLAELIVKRKINVGIAAVIFSIMGMQSIVEGYKLKKKIQLCIGVVWVLLGICMILAFVGELIL